MVPAPTILGFSATPGVATLRLFQADYLTGLPNAAEGFRDSSGTYARFQDRTALTPPPTMASSVQINKVTGRVRYSLVLLEPGAPQATQANVAGNNDVLQSVYELPISRALHNCRHNPGGTVNCVEAPP